MQDVEGADVRPLELGDAKAGVLLFLGTECPISNGFSPTINRIFGEYGGRGVRFWIVHVDPRLSAADAKTHAKEFGYTCPVLLDSKRRLVERLRPRVTPEAVVVLPPGGAVAYRGRIDDLYVDYGKRRAGATTRDLADALDAVLAGKPVARPDVPGVGCLIE